MKSLIFVLLCAALMSKAADAQKITADKVPAAVTSAFKAKFPAATKATWELEQGEYEAGFIVNGEKTSANFDKEGKWLETETEIKVDALPAAVNATLKKDFAGYKINEASKIKSVKNGNCYEAEIEKDKEIFDVLFSPDGKLISKS